METVILKIIVISAALIGFYYLFLERDRTFRFNRMFLVGALAFSYLVPFITIMDPFQTENKASLIVGELTQHLPTHAVGAATFSWSQVITALYIVITIFFLFKFIYSISGILLLKGKRIKYKGYKILIINNKCSPFSFLNSIYLGQNYLNNEQIDECLFLHEKCHVDEKHSLDILFIELLAVFSWYNPVLFLYKKAMRTNHEFLADNYVLSKNHSRSTYQQLILQEMSGPRNQTLVQSFNFNDTKKRFIMMTTTKSRFSWLKKISLLPLVAVLFLLFAKKMTAQTEARSVTAAKVPEAPAKPPVPVEAPDVPLVSGYSSDAVDNTVAVEEMKKDTIRKKGEEKMSAPTTPPPPPPPHEFKGVLPQFPNGINAYRSLLASAFDTSVLKRTTGTIRTTIYFNINEDGKISDIRAEGNNETFNREAERAVASTQDRVWTPAMENGKPVIYRFMMPLTMAFE